MNESTPPLAAPLPYDPETGEFVEHQGGLPAPTGGQTALGTNTIKVLMGTAITERRNDSVVRSKLRRLCAENGDRYVYSWEVKDRKNNRKTLIEGLTIKAAMDLWRVVGNCFAGPMDVEDRGGHWLFWALFFDRETGAITTRSFLQRKSQDTGMRDADRQADIIFQIGQSKAIRNVVVNALASEANYMLDQSKKQLLTWVQEHREKADAYIDRMLEDHGIDLTQIEAVIGKVRKQWSVRDFARVVTDLRGIDEGFQTAADAFPTAEAAKDLLAEKQTAAKEDTRTDTKTDKKPAEKPQTATKEPETEAAEEDKAPPKKGGRGRPKMTEEEKAAAKAEREAKKKAAKKPAEAVQEPAESKEPEPAPEDQGEPEASEPAGDAQEEASEGEDPGDAGEEQLWDFE